MICSHFKMINYDRRRDLAWAAWSYLWMRLDLVKGSAVDFIWAGRGKQLLEHHI